MIFAYADPPYIGQAKKHYSHDPNCAEVDHVQLIAEMNERYDGWALSLSSPTLQQILAMCPTDVRVGAWVKPFAAFKPNVNPAYAWEPVIFKGGGGEGRERATCLLKETGYQKASPYDVACQEQSLGGFASGYLKCWE